MKSYTFLIVLASGLVSIGGCSSSRRDMSKLKEELKQEILAELRQQGEISEHDSSQNVLKATQEQVRQQRKHVTESNVGTKIESQTQSQPQTTSYISTRAADASVQLYPSHTGRAEGYILYGGKGLDGCQVKLVRMLEGRSTVRVVSAVREGIEFTTITDEQGKYCFNNLPVGSYKLKWQLPGNAGWIRRLRDKPDAVVSDGKITVIKAVETNRRLVAH